MTSRLLLSSLVYPLTLLQKRISVASKRVMSRVVITHVSLPCSSAGVTTITTLVILFFRLKSINSTFR